MKEHRVFRTWAEIYLDRLANNMKVIREKTISSAEVMAVVKANGYGHGAVVSARTFLENGATYLAVCTIDEGIELRENGISSPVLVMGDMNPTRAHDVIDHDLTQTVCSMAFAKALNIAASEKNKRARIHIKVDTGMGRIGYLESPATIDEIIAICRLPQLDAEGLYSHLSSAEEKEEAYTVGQFEAFLRVKEALEKSGLSFKLCHICNSVALIRFPAMHLNMVRAGLILYGLLPNGLTHKDSDVAPAMSLKSRISYIKILPQGQPVGYNRAYVTKNEMSIATLPIGYADGYPRRLASRSYVLYDGEQLPVVGNICMDFCMLNISEVKRPIDVGDEVLVFGDDGQHALPAEQLAVWLETINYEIPCMVGRRVPRVYYEKGKIKMVDNPLLKTNKQEREQKA